MAFTEDHLSLLVENLVGNCASKSYHTVAILENIFKIAQIYPVFIYPNLRYIFWVYLELDWLRGFFKFENKNTYFITWMSIFFVLNHYLCLIKRRYCLNHLKIQMKLPYVYNSKPCFSHICSLVCEVNRLGKTFVAENFHHLAKISSLFPDENL